MKKLWLLFALLVPGFPLFAQTGALQGHCYLGGTPATTSGMNSSNYLNGIIPACTVKVYLHGTTTLATIYADGNNTPLANPFTANTASAVDPGGWIFYGVTNQGVDVVLSGGNSNPNCTSAPLCYTHPVTLSDVFPSQSFTPTSGVTSASATSPIEVNGGGGPATGAVTISCPTCGSSGITSLNTMTGPAVTVVGDSTITVTPNSPAANELQLHATGTGGSGVQYNPANTTYLFTGASVIGDDNHILSTGVSASNVQCNVSSSGVCIVQTATAHGLGAGSIVEMNQVTSPNLFADGTNLGTYRTGQDQFTVLSSGLTSTQFEFTYTGTSGSCSASCGTVYNASYYWPYESVTRAFLNGHGTAVSALPPNDSTLGNVNTINAMNAHFSTLFSPWYPATTGGPTFLIIEGGQNDLNFMACNALPTLETNFQEVWSQAHTAGMKVLQGTVTGAALTGSTCATARMLQAQLNEWIRAQGASFSTIGQGSSCPASYPNCYPDAVFDANYAVNDFNTSVANGGLIQGQGQYAPGGVSRLADLVNQTFSSQLSGVTGSPYPFLPNNLGGLDYYPGPTATQAALRIFDSAGTLAFGVNSQSDYASSPEFYAQNSLTAQGPTSSGGLLGENDNTGNSLPLNLYVPNISAGSAACAGFWEAASANNAFFNCLNYVAAGSSSNYLSWHAYGESGESFIITAGGAIKAPKIAPASGTAYLQIDNTGNFAPGNPTANGTATLVAGTVTVSSTTSCAVGATCNYQLTNCGVGGTVGVLSVGTITAGTSFVINSSSATDTSQVCWRIN